MAEVKGKRLLIAAEIQEGARLNDSTVKQLCSTDDVFAEKKYKDPFSFTPCHTLVLYTNHLRGQASTCIWADWLLYPTTQDEVAATSKTCDSSINAARVFLRWVSEESNNGHCAGLQNSWPRVRSSHSEYLRKTTGLGHLLEEKCELMQLSRKFQFALSSVSQLLH
jgi:hypothetical protein